MSSFVYRQEIDSSYPKKSCFILGSIIILGLTLRLWGLGNVGLHGDEDLTALSALGILRSGLPTLPSGLIYPRSPLHLYMAALSFWIFGVSEWALRLPSVLAGTLGIVFAFFMGRRFLPPKWNILFVLIIALNPWMITYSQTARMYIFFSASLILFATLLFRWEGNGRWSSLLIAFIAYLMAQQFHALAIFSSFLFFFPYVTHPSTKRLLQSSSAFILAGITFLAQRSWQSAEYGTTLAQTMSTSLDNLSAFEFLSAHHLSSIAALFLLCLFTLGMAFHIQQNKSMTFMISIAFFTGAIVASFFVQYHAAFLLYCCGIILFLRSSGPRIYLFVLTLLLLVLFFSQFYFISNSNIYPNIRKILKAFVGNFSIYAYLMFFEKFSIGLLLYTFPFLYAVRRIVTGLRVPDHFLFFFISILFPLFCQSFFIWYFPPRFSFQFVPIFVLSCLAGVFCLENCFITRFRSYRLKYYIVAACLLFLGFIKPLELKGTINPSCKKFPDHKGAGFFMQTINLQPGDLVLAEDVLHQVYYLGKVDYWLRGLSDAKGRVRETDGVLVNIYTNTPLIGTGEELGGLFKNTKRGFIYIIGSGETADFKSYFLSNGILDVLKEHTPQAELVYTGCDSKTLIWRFPPLDSPDDIFSQSKHLSQNR